MRGCRVRGSPDFFGATGSFGREYDARQSSRARSRAHESRAAADHDADGVRLSIRENLRQLRRRSAARRRQSRHGGARRGQHPGRHHRRGHLPHPCGCARATPCAGRRRHAVPVVPGKSRRRVAQRRPSGQGRRRRGGEARRRCRDSRRGGENHGGRYSRDGPRRTDAAVGSSDGRASRARPQIGPRARMPRTAARRRRRTRSRGRIRDRGRGRAAVVGARDNRPASLSRLSASAPGPIATARCS